MCTSTTRTCVDTCGRGAGIHGDVLNLHTEVFEDGHTGGDWRGKEGEERGVTVSSGNHETAHVELSRALKRFTERNPWFLPIQGLRTGREQHVLESSNHSLYLTKLLSSMTQHTTHNHSNTQQHNTTHNTQHTTHNTQHTTHTTHTQHTQHTTHTYSPTYPPIDPPNTTPLLLPPLSLTLPSHTQTHMYMHVYLCMCVYAYVYVYVHVSVYV